MLPAILLLGYGILDAVVCIAHQRTKKFMGMYLMSQFLDPFLCIAIHSTIYWISVPVACAAILLFLITARSNTDNLPEKIQHRIMRIQTILDISMRVCIVITALILIPA